VVPGTDDTGVFAAADGSLSILEVDGVVLVTPVTNPVFIGMFPSGGTLFLGTDGGAQPTYQQAWSGTAALDIEQMLLDANITFALGATKISLTYENRLTAFSEGTGIGATTAQIDKEAHTILTTTAQGPGQNNVPEPVSAVAWSILGMAFGIRTWRCRTKNPRQIERRASRSQSS
jgi:hypothetical protein